MLLDSVSGHATDLRVDPTTKGLLVKNVGAGVGGATISDQGAPGTVPWLVQTNGHVSIALVPTITTVIYATGNLMGGKLVAAGMMNAARLGGRIRTISIADKANQKAAIDVVCWGADPSGTTFTDHAALAVAAADLLKLVGHVSILAADYISFSANALATKNNINWSLKSTTTSLWFAMIARGTPTYASVSDLQLTVDFSQD
jgi:hypothetical protein